ncbi:MAG: hypothetical protein LBL87_00360 [Ruminococcus sp.]|nr:hypothetical protein [Ruminococcus sp.]
MSNNNMDQLLGILSQKTGLAKEDLKSDFESGKFDNAIKGMNPAQRQMFNAVMSNPNLIKNMMSSKQAQDLLNKIKK